MSWKSPRTAIQISPSIDALKAALDQQLQRGKILKQQRFQAKSAPQLSQKRVSADATNDAALKKEYGQGYYID